MQRESELVGKEEVVQEPVVAEVPSAALDIFPRKKKSKFVKIRPATWEKEEDASMFKIKTKKINKTNQ